MDADKAFSDNHIIMIDPQKEMTMPQYAAFKGVTPGRVSQLKTEGKLLTRYIAELNLELVILEPNEQALSRQFPKLPPSVQHYTFRQVGTLFSEMLINYEKNLSHAERISREQHERAENSVQEIKKLQFELEELQQHADILQGEKEAIRENLVEVKQLIDEEKAQQAGLLEEFKVVREHNQQLTLQIQDLEQKLRSSEKEQAVLEGRLDTSQELMKNFAALSKEVADIKKNMTGMLPDLKKSSKKTNSKS